MTKTKYVPNIANVYFITSLIRPPHYGDMDPSHQYTLALYKQFGFQKTNGKEDWLSVFRTRAHTQCTNKHDIKHYH